MFVKILDIILSSYKYACNIIYEMIIIFFKNIINKKNIYFS